MATPDRDEADREGLAAEFVLGTLDAEERAMARRLLRTDRAFATEVARWRARLDPLLDAVPELEAPAESRDAVLAAILAVEAIEERQRPQTRFLGHVVGVLRVAGEPSREVVCRIQVRQHGAFESRQPVWVSQLYREYRGGHQYIPRFPIF